MLFTGTEVIMVVGAIAGLAIGIQLLRFAYRICSHFSVVGLMLSVAFLGWAAQNPDALPQLSSSASPEVMAEVGADTHQADEEFLGADVSDEDMADSYRLHNTRYADEVAAAPGKARRTVGL